jgi:hypothetical protein
MKFLCDWEANGGEYGDTPMLELALAIVLGTRLAGRFGRAPEPKSSDLKKPMGLLMPAGMSFSMDHAIESRDDAVAPPDAGMSSSMDSSLVA